MSNWITDRRPTEADSTAPHYCVYDERGCIVHCLLIADGEPWKPVPKCEPYVKPKRWGVREFGKSGQWYIVEVTSPEHAWGFTIPTREAAGRIAAIYEEVMP